MYRENAEQPCGLAVFSRVTAATAIAAATAAADVSCSSSTATVGSSSTLRSYLVQQ